MIKCTSAFSCTHVNLEDCTSVLEKSLSCMNPVRLSGRNVTLILFKFFSLGGKAYKIRKKVSIFHWEKGRKTSALKGNTHQLINEHLKTDFVSNKQAANFVKK